MEVTPLSVHIGAEIGGVDLSAPLSDADVGAIRDALLTWKVVFFRGQHLEHAGARRTSARRNVRHADARPCRLRRHRPGPSRDLLGRQAPRGQPQRRCRRGASLDRLAHRHHRGDQPARGLDPARSDGSALRRRHAVDQPRGRLPGALPGHAGVRRRCGLRSGWRWRRFRRRRVPGAPVRGARGPPHLRGTVSTTRRSGTWT